MKFTFVTLSFLLATSAFASETYLRSGWLGEYPLNFEVKKTVKVATRQAPESALAPLTTCELKRGAKFGPLQNNKAADYYTRSLVQPMKANVDTEMSSYDQSGKEAVIKVRAGQTVDELSYLSEGICAVRFEGQIFETECPSILEEGKFSPVGEVIDPELRHQEWLNVECRGLARRQWILLRDLEPLLKNGTLKELPMGG